MGETEDIEQETTMDVLVTYGDRWYEPEISMPTSVVLPPEGVS